MPKQARLSGIKAFRCYTFEEAADIVGVTTRTIRSWTCQGLQVMDSVRPALIRGDDLRSFIKDQRKGRKVTTAFDEFYCLPCRAARKPAGAMADCEVTKTRAKLTALCEHCETVVTKPIEKARIPEIARILDLTITRLEATL